MMALCDLEPGGTDGLSSADLPASHGPERRALHRREVSLRDPAAAWAHRLQGRRPGAGRHGRAHRSRQPGSPPPNLSRQSTCCWTWVLEPRKSPAGDGGARCGSGRLRLSHPIPARTMALGGNWAPSGDCRVKQWFVIFDRRPRRSERVDTPLYRFDYVAKTAEMDGRKIFGMWIIDHETEQVDVTKIHGHVPENILRLYDASGAADEKRPQPVGGRKKKAPPVRAGRSSAFLAAGQVAVTHPGRCTENHARRVVPNSESTQMPE
jgi:hypothetical protein